MEKTYQVESSCLEIVEQALSLRSKENSLKATKKATQDNASELVQYFVDNNKVDDLPLFLTDQFTLMEERLVFGVKGIYVNGVSGAQLHTAKKQAASRFFATAFKRIVKTHELKGNAPFKIEPVIPEAIKTPESQINELCESLGMDIVATQACHEAYTNSVSRLTIRRQEADKRLGKMLTAKREQAIFEERQKVISAFLSSGLTLEDITAAQKEKTA